MLYINEKQHNSYLMRTATWEAQGSYQRKAILQVKFAPETQQ